MVGNFAKDEHELMTLAEVQCELTKLLIRFDGFCKDHGLRYSLHAGTLLGAVRHKGFIPWDDDVDVSMPRPDFDRLMWLLDEDELPEGLSAVDAAKTVFPYPFIKICTNAVRAQEPCFEGKFEEFLWIDVFPIDGVPESEEALESVQRDIRKKIKSVMDSVITYSHQAWKTPGKKVRAFLLGLWNPRAKMFELVEEVISNYGYENATRVSGLFDGEKHAWSIPREGYEETVEMEFEGHMLPVMGCWDEYLTKVYGDYMQLPPEDKRRTHCVRAWRLNKD